MFAFEISYVNVNVDSKGQQFMVNINIYKDYICFIVMD